MHDNNLVDFDEIKSQIDHYLNPPADQSLNIRKIRKYSLIFLLKRHNEEKEPVYPEDVRKYLIEKGDIDPDEIEMSTINQLTTASSTLPFITGRLSSRGYRFLDKYDDMCKDIYNYIKS